MIPRILATTGIIILLSPERSLHIALLHALCWACSSSITAKNIYRRWKDLAIIISILHGHLPGYAVSSFSRCSSSQLFQKTSIGFEFSCNSSTCFTLAVQQLLGLIFDGSNAFPLGSISCGVVPIRCLSAWMERVQGKPNCRARWLRYGGSGASRSGISGVYYALVSYFPSWITGLMNCSGWGLKGIKLDSKFT